MYYGVISGRRIYYRGGGVYYGVIWGGGFIIGGDVLWGYLG